jgi:hypothetical protein
MRLGSALIWIGVLAWVPFILMQVNGNKPSLLWFLPFHLLGVISGTRLRSTARDANGTPRPPRNPVRTAGRMLIYAGVLVWLPYFYLRLVAGRPVEVVQFLPYHLAGLLGGLGLLAASNLLNRRES